MDLNKLYSPRRTGANNKKTSGEPRSNYRRDFDRIVFSSSFRRLQNKTQVFPLPGSVFVHNRLTHSLEVSSVGRSLGVLVGEHIINEYKNSLNDDSKEFYKYNLSEVISAACLCHDIGNPAFGHSGEAAISNFFIENKHRLKPHFTDEQWADFENFEGNANAIRCLTATQPTKAEGGLGLTYSTLSAIAKYPCESLAINKGDIHRKKFGFFQGEKEIFLEIAEDTAMCINPNTKRKSFYRHPFVWLVEAADDICYNIIDLEDAHRLKIIETQQCFKFLRDFLKGINPEKITSIDKRLKTIEDKNDKIAYLRAMSIGALTMECANLFTSNFAKIYAGELQISLYNLIKEKHNVLRSIGEFSVENIYNHRSVVEIENAGYHVIYELLEHCLFPVMVEKKKRTPKEEKAVQLISPQFLYEKGDKYQKTMGIIDYISGMTDNYAVELYKKIRGVNMGMSSTM